MTDLIDPILEDPDTPESTPDIKGEKTLTAIVQVLDRSGSMATNNFIEEVRTGYNKYIEDLCTDDPGETIAFTVVFASRPEVIVDGVAIQEVSPLSRDEFYPAGGTALNDAVALGIRLVDNWCDENDRTFDNVLFEIQTDGEENSSTEYSRRSKEAMDAFRKQMKQKEAAGWVFTMVGADDSVFDAAIDLGFSRDMAVRGAAGMSASSAAAQNYFHAKTSLAKSLREGAVTSDSYAFSEDLRRSLKEEDPK